MRTRRLPLLLAVALAALVACGGNDDASSEDTTTTTESGPGTTGSTIAPTVEASLSDIARVIVQLDDRLRTSMASARPCLDADKARCTGVTLEHYDAIGVTGKQMVEILPLLIKEGSTLYQGRPTGDIVARVDATVNLGAELRAAFDAAREVCVPDFPPACADANAAIESVLTEVLKDFNRWRDDYDPATDPGVQGQGGGVVIEPDE